MTSEPGAEPLPEEMATQPAETVQPAEQTTATPETTTIPEGRRTQLKIVREGVESLTADVWSFRRKHESSIRKLEAQVSSLRRDLSGNASAKALESHDKGHQASNKRLEKQVASLRKELASLKSSMAKDAARARAREEAALSKILAKVSQKPKAGKKKTSKKR